jgi:hypothetical protein
MNLHVDWECPSCGKETRVEAKFGKVVHQCPQLGGMTTPYVRKGVKAKHELVLRQDYVGDELVQTDDQGRPVQSIVTTRDQGQDVRVFAPAAQMRFRA